jgi:hypothetical protein
MNPKFYISAVLLASFALASHSQVIPQIAIGTPYKKVRTALIKEGWTPVRQNAEPYDTLGGELRKKGWIEVKICAGTGVAPCVFVWQNEQGKQLEVVTKYENPRFNGFR